MKWVLVFLVGMKEASLAENNSLDNPKPFHLY